MYRSLILNFLLCGLFISSAHASQQQVITPELRNLLKTAITESDSFRDKFEAEVWLIDMSNRLKPFIKNDEKRIALLKQVHYEATRAKLRPELVLAVIEVESRFDKFAISHAGALGLMQVMPFWLDEIGRPEDNLFDMKTNLRMGCTILRHYLDKEDGDLTHALARYNGSLYSHRYTSKVFRALDKRWRCINC
ncbi:MAG: lytic transglycosylase domain-containing protein [Thioalkalispiraceae bacterium]|jgi:soluble lytic murein transglycosylase-like protein